MLFTALIKLLDRDWQKERGKTPQFSPVEPNLSLDHMHDKADTISKPSVLLDCSLKHTFEREKLVKKKYLVLVYKWPNHNFVMCYKCLALRGGRVKWQIKQMRNSCKGHLPISFWKWAREKSFRNLVFVSQITTTQSADL